MSEYESLFKRLNCIISEQPQTTEEELFIIKCKETIQQYNNNPNNELLEKLYSFDDSEIGNTIRERWIDKNYCVNYRIPTSQENLYENYKKDRTVESKPQSKPIQSTEPKSKKTDLGSKILPILIFIPIVISVLLAIVSAFVDVWEFSKGSIGLFLINLVAIPLAFVGGLKVVKGLYIVASEAVEKYNLTKDWQLSTYVVITFFEIIALVYVFLKL